MVGVAIGVELRREGELRARVARSMFGGCLLAFTVGLAISLQLRKEVAIHTDVPADSATDSFLRAASHTILLFGR